MKAMILAAGRGSRLRPLTDNCPKPLIKVIAKPLIVYHIENLAAVGITDIVINLSYLGEQIIDYIGNGEKWGVHVSYSEEEKLLEVGGGIFNALPLLGQKPFLVVNADIWTDYDFTTLPKEPGGLAHLVLVKNPAHHLNGDFSLRADGMIVADPMLPKYTYAGISVLRPELFYGCQPNSIFPLAPLLVKAMNAGALVGEYYAGIWNDIGTIDRLKNLEATLNYHTTLRKIS
ncbi:MAG: N-acetylmuramate alpha-1-phosphate uridylyltransferase MurU [Candidatus Berkiella sp.]